MQIRGAGPLWVISTEQNAHQVLNGAGNSRESHQERRLLFSFWAERSYVYGMGVYTCNAWGLSFRAPETQTLRACCGPDLGFERRRNRTSLGLYKPKRNSVGQSRPFFQPFGLPILVLLLGGSGKFCKTHLLCGCPMARTKRPCPMSGACKMNRPVLCPCVFQIKVALDLPARVLLETKRSKSNKREL